MPKPGYQPPPRQPPPKPGPPRQPPKPGPPRQPPPPPHRACALFNDAIAIAAIHAAAIRAVTIFLITSPRSRCTVQLLSIEPNQRANAFLRASSVVAAGHLGGLPPHLVELPCEIVDLAAALGRRFFRRGRAAGVQAFAPRERREHGKRALEHFHVSLHRFFQRTEWAAAE